MKDLDSLLNLIPNTDRGAKPVREWIDRLSLAQKEALERFLLSIEGMIDADIPFLHYFFIYCDPSSEHPLGINAIHGGNHTQPEDVLKLTRAMLDGLRALHRGAVNLTFSNAEDTKGRAESLFAEESPEDVIQLDLEFTHRLIPLREKYGDERMSSVIGEVVRDLCTARKTTFEEERASANYAEFIKAVEWEVSKRLGHLTA